jgi:UDP-glucose 4-epimerase
MRVLVTGAAGFIGSHVSDRFVAAGHEVVGVDDLSTGKLGNWSAAASAGAVLHEVDVLSDAFVDLVGQVRPEVICHLAAQIDVRISVADPLRDARLNVLGTVTVLEAARRAGTRKVVHTSSGGSIYGTPAALPVSEAVPADPESPYAASKLCGEVYLGTYRHLYGLQTSALALSNVFGPRQDPHGEAGVVAIFCTALLEGRPTKIFGDGTSTRDYVYVADVAEAFLAASGEAGDGLRFNIGTGRETSVRELHSIVAAAVEGAADEPILAEPRLGELQAIALDCTRAAEVLGWKPATSLEAGIPLTVAHIKAALAG